MAAKNFFINDQAVLDSMATNPNTDNTSSFSQFSEAKQPASTQAFVFWEAGKKQLTFYGKVAGLSALLNEEHAISLYAFIRKIGLSAWHKLREAIQSAPNLLPFRYELWIEMASEKGYPLHLHLLKQKSGKLWQLSCYLEQATTSKSTLLNTVFPLLLEKVPVVVNLIDKSGKVMHISGGGLPMVRLKENETVGQSIFEQYPPITPYVKRAMQGEQVRFKEEIRQNGNTHYFLSYFLPIEEMGLVAGLSFDVTNQGKDAEERAFHRVQHVNQELKERNQLLDTVVYATAHDLKTPIANLEVLMDLYESASTDQERDNYWQALRQSSQRLKSTSQGLMEVISFDNTESNADNIDFPKLSRSLLEEHRAELEKLNASVSLKFQVKNIRYNRAYLESILRNLISNSIKYHHEGRSLEISIKTEAVEDGVLLAAADNGIGIDMNAHKSRVFKPFKRFSQQAEGTGVGLYLMKRIIERNGGGIEIDSAPNEGCSVRCTLVPYD